MNMGPKSENYLFQKTINGRKRWYYWYRDSTGRRIQRSLGVRVQNRFEAEQMLSLVERRGLTFASFAHGFFDECSPWMIRQQAKGVCFRPATLISHRTHLHNFLLPLFRDTSLDSISTNYIENELLKLDISNSYRNHILGTLKIIMKEAKRNNLIDTVPEFERYRTQAKRRDSLSLLELKKLFPVDIAQLTAVWGNDEYALMFGTMFALAVSTGLRSGELRALEHHHVDCARRAVIVEQAFDSRGIMDTPKSSAGADIRIRVVPISERTVRYLLAYCNTLSTVSRYLFTFQGKPVRAELLRNRLYRGFRWVGIDRSERKLDVHALRYTYNTRMAIAVKHDVLREWIGHRSEAMTQHYLAPNVEDRLAEYQQYSKEVEGFWG